MAWTASFNRTDTYIDLETDISLNDFSIAFENVIFNIATPSGQSQVLSGSQSSFNYAIGIVPDQWFVRIAGVYYYFDFTSIGSPVNNRGTFTVTRTGDQLTADFNGTSETVTSTTLPMFFGGFGLFNMSFVTPVHIPDGEIGDTTLNDGTSDVHKWDYTNSDHNSGTDPITNPFTVTDAIGEIDGMGINMTDANWIDLGGGDNSLTVTEDSALSIEDNTVTATVSTINENSSLSLTDATLLSTTVSLIENSEITINDTSVTSSKTIIIDNSDIEIIDTTIVVFKTSGNSLTTTEDTDLSLTDSTIVAFSSIINESTELSSVDTTLNYFPTAVIEDGVFAASDETITAFSSRIVENAALELVDTTVINFPSGDFNPIIGLTLELSSDIITLELSSEQEIRELA